MALAPISFDPVFPLSSRQSIHPQLCILLCVATVFQPDCNVNRIKRLRQQLGNLFG